MKYFIDTEFLEGTQKKLFGKTKPTIDLISIGIVCEDGREYYAISKDFNLKEAWNRYDLKEIKCHAGDIIISDKNTIRKDSNTILKKEYWIRENVLKPIFIELRAKEVEEYNIAQKRNVIIDFPTYKFDYKSFKRLINKYGKSNKQIAEEIKDFIAYSEEPELHPDDYYYKKDNWNFKDVQFYGYFADYDWVVFCWLFGKMIDLPKGFPMYCIDLKQTLDEKAEPLGTFRQSTPFISMTGKKQEDIMSKEQWIDGIKTHNNYPKQTNEHNALADAKWNFKLYKFLQSINN